MPGPGSDLNPNLYRRFRRSNPNPLNLNLNLYPGSNPECVRPRPTHRGKPAPRPDRRSRTMPPARKRPANTGRSHGVRRWLGPAPGHAPTAASGSAAPLPRRARCPSCRRPTPLRAARVRRGRSRAHCRWPRPPLHGWRRPSAARAVALAAAAAARRFAKGAVGRPVPAVPPGPAQAFAPAFAPVAPRWRQTYWRVAFGGRMMPDSVPLAAGCWPCCCCASSAMRCSYRAWKLTSARCKGGSEVRVMASAMLARR